MNIPNGLTLLRIFLIPLVLLWATFGNETGHLIAACFFILASITDFFDGYLARTLDQTSVLGEFMDPVADKLLVASTLMVLVAIDRIAGISVIPALIILCREILVSGLREFLADVRVSMPVSRMAKWKTASQMVAIPCLLAGDQPFLLLPLAFWGTVLLWIAAGLTIVTGYDYLKAGLLHLKK